ncbi:unnamed protein product [Cylindrotheca closterium]|uniref:Uncharacterized protein n=1 Tax=Cylindrotheca closterium TaxID=2856 RepID=A0AAD2G912_9STRA|nr:unnamed protein product [Cylindrotheca closterium]
MVLTMSTSLAILQIAETCRFEHGAGLKVMKGVERNKSLNKLIISESNLSMVAMSSILRAVSDGEVPKLVTLDVKLKPRSDCIQLLTRLMCSDTCHLEDLKIDEDDYDISSMFRTDGIPTGTVNRMLEKLEICFGRFDDSYLASLLPMMPNLLDLDLKSCNLSDISPIVNHLCHPSTAIRTIELCDADEDIGLDQVEYFASHLRDMQSLTDVYIGLSFRGDDENDGLERFQNILRIFSSCWNLETFEFYGLSDTLEKLVKESNLNLTFAINGGWRRELCYNQHYRESSAPPPKLLPLIIARALRNTTVRSLRADVVLSLLRERIGDIIRN